MKTTGTTIDPTGFEHGRPLRTKPEDARAYIEIVLGQDFEIIPGFDRFRPADFSGLRPTKEVTYDPCMAFRAINSASNTIDYRYINHLATRLWIECSNGNKRQALFGRIVIISGEPEFLKSLADLLERLAP